MATEDTASGGEGGGIVLSRSDLAVLRKCADRFPFVDDERKEVVEWVMDAGRKAKSPRTKLAAAKTAALLEKVNLQEIATLLAARKQVEEIAKGGVNVNVNVQQNTIEFTERVARIVAQLDRAEPVPGAAQAGQLPIHGVGGDEAGPVADPLSD